MVGDDTHIQLEEQQVYNYWNFKGKNIDIYVQWFKLCQCEVPFYAVEYQLNIFTGKMLLKSWNVYLSD